MRDIISKFVTRVKTVLFLFLYMQYPESWECEEKWNLINGLFLESFKTH